MMFRSIACAAVLLTAAVVSAQDGAMQDKIAQESAAMAERRAVEVQAMAQAQGGGRGGVLTAARVPLEFKIVKGAPYSAEVVTESTQPLADGNRIVHKMTGRVYRDGQGRTRREDDAEPGRVANISISDPVAAVVYSLEPESKTAWKTSGATAGALVGVARMVAPTPGDPAEIERRQKVEAEMVAAARSGGGGGAGARGGRGGAATVAPSSQPLMKAQRAPAWDEKTEVLPAKNIEGVMAEGKRTTRTIPAGAIGNEQPIVSVTEEWRSAELQVLVMTRTSDPRTGEYVYKLQNITRAEPNSSWFEVPADYTLKESGVRKLMQK